MDFIAEGFELVLELGMFRVQSPEFIVVGHQLLDELFVVSLHGLSLAPVAGGTAAGLKVASALRTYNGSTMAGLSFTPRAIASAPSIATYRPREFIPISSMTVDRMPLSLSNNDVSLAFGSPTSITPSESIGKRFCNFITKGAEILSSRS